MTYAYRENMWIQRAVAVPTGQIPAAEAEGLVAYASKQAQLYRDLAVAAETVRTEEKLRKGRVFRPAPDPVMPLEEEEIQGSDDEDHNEDDDDEPGEVDSDEELLMGGEVDDD